MAKRKKPETLEELTAEMERSEKQLHYCKTRKNLELSSIGTYSKGTNQQALHSGRYVGIIFGEARQVNK